MKIYFGHYLLIFQAYLVFRSTVGSVRICHDAVDIGDFDRVYNIDKRVRVVVGREGGNWSCEFYTVVIPCPQLVLFFIILLTSANDVCLILGCGIPLLLRFSHFSVNYM